MKRLNDVRNKESVIWKKKKEYELIEKKRMKKKVCELTEEIKKEKNNYIKKNKKLIENENIECCKKEGVIWKKKKERVWINRKKKKRV